MKVVDKHFKATCPELMWALSAFADGDDWAKNTLVDLWLTGIPAPQTRIHLNEQEKKEYLAFMRSRHYDPRKDAVTVRFVSPSKLSEWLVDVSKRRGEPISKDRAKNILSGMPDLGDVAE